MTKLILKLYEAFYSFGKILREVKRIQADNKKMLAQINKQHIIQEKHLRLEAKMIKSNEELLEDTEKQQQYLIYLRTKK